MHGGTSEQRMRPMLRTNVRALCSLLALAGATLATAATAQQAHAAFPGIDGRFAYTQPSEGGTKFTLWAVNPDGTGAEQLTTHAGSDFYPRWSPDSTKIVYTHRISGQDADIRIYDWATEQDVPLTDDAVDQTYASWHPDGIHVIYEQDGDVWMRNANPNSSEEPVNLTQTDGVSETDPAMNPAGTKLAFRQVSGGDGDIRILTLAGANVDNITNNADEEAKPQWSPAGDKLTFAREIVENQISQFEVYAVSTLGGGVPQRLTTDAGTDYEPVYAPTGSKIAWRGGRAFNGGAAFARIWTMSPAGASQTAISASINAFMIDWGSNLSPHGGGPAPDGDGDGVSDANDNCPAIANPGQQNTYGDARGDACEDKPKQDEPKNDEPKQEAPKVEPPKQAPPKTPVITIPPVAELRADNMVVASKRACVSRRQFQIRLRIPKGTRIASGKAVVVSNGKSNPAKFVNGRHRANVDLRDLPKGRFAVKITVKTEAGKTVTTTRRYRTCAPKKKS